MATALVVAAAGVVPSLAVAEAADTASSPATSMPALEAVDGPSAMAMAYRYRKPVLVTGETSPTSMVWAQPDGTFRAEIQSAPVRARTATGQWADVDLTLERTPDGSIGSRVSPYGLWLTGSRSADSDVLVRLGSGAQRASLGWRGSLPEPHLSGATATYRQVKPDVDLVVEARSTGFRYSFLVHTPAAAAGMATVSMPWSTGVDSANVARSLSVDSPVQVSQGEMWDARVSSSGEPLHRGDVAVQSQVIDGRTNLVMTPDEEFLSTPGLTFPVTIDPSVNLNPSFDAYVQNTISSTDKSGDDELRLGYVVDSDQGCGSPCIARSFLAFNGLGGYAGADVVSAELFLWNFYSYSCTKAQWETWRVDAVSSSVRWGSQPTWRDRDGVSDGTKGYSSNCGDGWVSASVKETLQYALNDSSSTAYVGLRASSESSNSGWKKFNSSDASSNKPYVTLVYNRRPNVPTELAIDSCYSACKSPAVVRSGRPTLSAKVSDPDGGTLRTEYEVFDNAKTTLKVKSGTAVTGVSSGTARPWQVSVELPDATYHYRVRACDSRGCGGYSGWFTFTVNTQDPSLPTVTGTPYAEQSTGTWNGGPGQPGTFTFGPNGASDVQEYIYYLDGSPFVTVPAGAPQAEVLSQNQQHVSTDLTGFSGHNATIARDTTRGHNSSDSLKITPLASGGTTTGPQGDTFAALGGDVGGMRLGMQPGKRYWIQGWIYVPATTGLNVSGTYGASRGLRIAAFYKVGSLYVEVTSAKATMTDGWQQLSLVMSVPAGATEALVRLYNGFPVGQTSKPVYWDDLSVKEVVGTSTTVTIIPQHDLTNVLSVYSRNSAGATSDPRVYQFLVTPSDGEWAWTFEDSAIVQSAASTPAGATAYYSSRAVSQTDSGLSGKAVSLDGTAYLSTTSRVLDTSNPAGFTVAAWARLTDLTTPRTAVAQLGANSAMFRLGYRNDVDVDGDTIADPAWCFTVTKSDSATAEQVNACTTQRVAPDDWVSLVGVYDKPSNMIHLYVGGVPANDGTKVSVDFFDGWSATGKFVMGRGWDATDSWVGDLDEVRAAQHVWIDSEINQHAGLGAS